MPDLPGGRARPFDLLVFDWDGTLSDSLESIVASLESAIAAAGMPARSPVQLRAIIGLGLDEGIDWLYPGLAAVQRGALANHYREHYRRHAADQARLFPGVAETIAHLHACGYALAVATGKSRRGLDNALRQTGLAGYMHATRSMDEAASKPHPQMLHDLMLEVDAAPERTLMIGDSEHDLRMARNAGVAAVGVRYGAQDPAHLVESGALTILDALSDLPPWLTARTGGAS